MEQRRFYLWTRRSEHHIEDPELYTAYAGTHAHHILGLAGQGP